MNVSLLNVYKNVQTCVNQHFKVDFNEVNITIDNAGGNEYMLAVRGADGNIHLADSNTKIESIWGFYGDGGRFRREYAAFILNPNPPSNNPDDFDIRQNAQGGITITGYRGTGRQLTIPEIIEGLRVTEIGRDAFRERNLLMVVIINSHDARQLFIDLVGNNEIKKHHGEQYSKNKNRIIIWTGHPNRALKKSYCENILKIVNELK